MGSLSDWASKKIESQKKVFGYSNWSQEYLEENSIQVLLNELTFRCKALGSAAELAAIQGFNDLGYKKGFDFVSNDGSPGKYFEANLSDKQLENIESLIAELSQKVAQMGHTLEELKKVQSLKNGEI